MRKQKYAPASIANAKRVVGAEATKDFALIEAIFIQYQRPARRANHSHHMAQTANAYVKPHK